MGYGIIAAGVVVLILGIRYKKDSEFGRILCLFMGATGIAVGLNLN